MIERLSIVDWERKVASFHQIFWGSRLLYNNAPLRKQGALEFLHGFQGARQNLSYLLLTGGQKVEAAKKAQYTSFYFLNCTGPAKQALCGSEEPALQALAYPRVLVKNSVTLFRQLSLSPKKRVWIEIYIYILHLHDFGNSLFQILPFPSPPYLFF